MPRRIQRKHEPVFLLFRTRCRTVWWFVVVCLGWCCCLFLLVCCCCYLVLLLRFLYDSVLLCPFGGFVVLFVLDVVTCSGFVASVLLCLVLNLKLISLFPLL